MNKKIIGILVCALLISTAAISMAVNVGKSGSNSRGWSEAQKLLASDGGANDRFGSAVEINGNDAIVGAYFDDVSSQSNAGSAYVFVYSGSTWTQQARLTASDAQQDDEFGYSVSIDGDYAIVGAHEEDTNGAEAGAAYVFYRSGTSWSQQQKLTPGDAAAGDYFGKSVSIDGEYAIVGAPGKNSDQGFSYIFKRSGTSWSQMTKVGATGSNKLGWSVSISMPCVIMGAYGTNSNTGAAHIYELVGSSWYGRGALTASDGLSYDLLGLSVAIDGDYAICGAPGHDTVYPGDGAAYIFEKPTTGWTTMTETQKISASDGASADEFGFSVSVYGDHLVVGIPADDDAGTASGSAFVFEKDITSWSEKAKLTASDAASQDYFAWSASVSGDFALVGAYAEDNTNGVDAGSAYVFEWTNQAPTPPIITGPTNGKVGTSYTYSFTSTDGDGDQVSYYVEWGDTTNTGWFGPFASGVTQTKSHTWTSQGTYTIKAKAKDVHGDEGAFNTYSVTIPRNKAFNRPILNWLQSHPNMFPLLQKLIQQFGFGL
jgi:hypothetical protein